MQARRNEEAMAAAAGTVRQLMLEEGDVVITVMAEPAPAAGDGAAAAAAPLAAALPVQHQYGSHIYLEYPRWAIARITSQAAGEVKVHWLGCQDLKDGLNCPYEPYSLLRDGKERWQDSKKWDDEIDVKAVLYKLQPGDWAKNGNTAGDSGRRLNTSFLKSLPSLLPSLRFEYLSTSSRGNVLAEKPGKGKTAAAAAASTSSTWGEAESSDDEAQAGTSMREGGRKRSAAAAVAQEQWPGMFTDSEKRAAASSSRKGKGKARVAVQSGGAASRGRKRPYIAGEGSS